MSSPVTRVIASLRSEKSDKFVGSCQALPSPVVVGVQSGPGWTPLPQKKTPNVVGSGAPCANAVPFSLHMMSSTGSHMATPTPESMPRRAYRRENLSLSRISILHAPYGQCWGGTEGVAGHEIGEKVEPDVVVRRERLNQGADLGRVGDIVQIAVDVAIEIA